MSEFDTRKKIEVTQGEIVGQGKDIFFSNPAKKRGRPTKEKKEEYVRQTFHISAEYKQAVAVMSAHENLDKSEIVRKALEKYVPKKYLQMVVAPDEN